MSAPPNLTLADVNGQDPNFLLDLVKRIQKLEGQIKEIPDTLPPQSGTASSIKRGYMSKETYQAVSLHDAKLAGINVSHAADANGWTVDYLPNGIRMFRKIVNATLTAATVQANSYTLPVGIATMGAVTWDVPACRASANSEAFHAQITSTDAATNLTVGLRAVVAGNLNSFTATTVDYVLTLIER